MKNEDNEVAAWFLMKRKSVDRALLLLFFFKSIRRICSVEWKWYKPKRGIEAEDDGNSHKSARNEMLKVQCH